MMPLSSKFRLISAALAMSAALFAADAACAHGGGGHGGSGGYVPVHGSPPLNGGGGVLVTHGNLKFSPPPITIVRDHRHGGYYGCGGYGYRGSNNCASGGVTVRDHRH